MLSEEIKKREVVESNLVAFGEELDGVEVKWQVKLEDANEKIARLQQQIKEVKKTHGTQLRTQLP